jgi:hypothetical protein
VKRRRHLRPWRRRPSHVSHHAHLARRTSNVAHRTLHVSTLLTSPTLRTLRRLAKSRLPRRHVATLPRRPRRVRSPRHARRARLLRTLADARHVPLPMSPTSRTPQWCLGTYIKFVIRLGRPKSLWKFHELSSAKSCRSIFLTSGSSRGALSLAGSTRRHAGDTQ